MPVFECKIVEVCVCSKINGAYKFLLLKRSKNVSLYPGQWQIVTGHLEENETLLNASLRELKEETGFVPTKYWILPHTNTFVDPQKDIVNVTAIFAGEVLSNTNPILSNEHDEYYWADLQEIKNILVWPGQINAINIFNDYLLSGKETEILSRINLN